MDAGSLDENSVGAVLLRQKTLTHWISDRFFWQFTGIVLALIFCTMSIPTLGVWSVVGICGLITILFFFSPSALLLSLILLRASIDNFSRQYNLFAESNSSINLLGLLNITIILIAILYFFIIKQKIPRYPFVGTYALFLIITFASMFVAQNYGQTLRGMTTIGSYFCVYILIVSNFKSEVRLSWLRSALALSSIFPIIVGTKQLATGSGNTIISPGLNRIMGTFFHPSVFGMYLVILWPLLLYQARYTRRRWMRLVYIMLLAMATLSIGLTYTRIAWIALALCFVGATILYRRFDLLIGAGIVTIIAGGLMIQPILSRFQEAFIIENGSITFSKYGSVAWRLGQWRTAYELFLNNPILGVGWWNFQLYNVFESTPHNDYIRVIVEAGLLGIISYLGLCFSLVFRFFRAYRKISPFQKETHLIGSVFISILGYLLLGITDNPLGLPEVGWYFWAIIALGINTIQIAKIKMISTTT
jgi:O-antigen ligase